MRVFICKLSVLLWCLVHSLLHGHSCNFLHVKKFKNKGKKRRWCFIEKKIKKTTLKHPPFFLFPFSFLMPFFFSIAISKMNNLNTQIILESQATINMWRWLMLLVRYCHIYYWFFKSNFIIKYARSSTISKVLPKEVTKF